MQSHPSKISAKSVKTIKIVWKELEERTVKLVIGKPLDVNLRGYKDEYAKNKGNEQTFESFSQILASIPEFKGKS